MLQSDAVKFICLLNCTWRPYSHEPPKAFTAGTIVGWGEGANPLPPEFVPVTDEEAAHFQALDSVQQTAWLIQRQKERTV